MTALAQLYVLPYDRARAFNQWQRASCPNFRIILFCAVRFKVISPHLYVPYEGKAGWDCAREKKHFFVLLTCLFGRNGFWVILLKTVIWVSSILKAYFETLYTFYKRWRVTNSFLRGAALLLLRILYLRLMDETNKNSCIRRSFSLCGALTRWGSIPSWISFV